MRTRSDSDYAHDTMAYCQPSQSTMEMDVLDAAITLLNVTGRLMTEHLAQLLRGLAKTITGKFDLLIAKKTLNLLGVALMNHAISVIVKSQQSNSQAVFSQNFTVSKIPPTGIIINYINEKRKIVIHLFHICS